MLAAAGVVLVAGLRWSLPAYTVASASMTPTLRCGGRDRGCRAAISDRIVIDRLSYLFESPGRRDLVAFRSASAARACGEPAGTVFVKRIVGLPGETVSEVRGTVLVDGRRLAEPYAATAARESGLWKRGPAGSYFVLGDDRGRSCDSRRFGPLVRSALIGRVVLTYWPLGRLTFH